LLRSLLALIFMESIDLLIVNGTLLTMDAALTRIEQGAVGIRKNRIAFVGKRSDLGEVSVKEEIDAGGGILLPGLVNTHTHLPMSLFRGLADDLPLDIWLNRYIFPAEAAHLNPETVRIGTLLSCAEMLLSGTTTCCDGYFFEDAVAEALIESGMRGVLAQGVIDAPAPGIPDPKKNMEQALVFLEKWSRRHPAVSPSLFCHSLYTCTPDTLTRAKSLALEHGVLFQIHAAETRFETEFAKAAYQTTPVRFLDRMGILDDRTLLVHVVWVDEEEITRIAEKKTAVSHNPESNMKLASGIAPVPKFLSKGIPTGLGTDGCASNNDLDLISEMRSAALLHKVAAFDPGVVDASTVLQMATLQGARAVGLGDHIGSIEIGKAADIVILDTAKPRLTPSYDPVSLMVYAASGADVRDVIVDGKSVVRNGRLQTLDLEVLLSEARRICRRIGAGLGTATPLQTR